MGAILQTIKRRLLLGGSKSRGGTAEPERGGKAVASPAAVAPAMKAAAPASPTPPAAATAGWPGTVKDAEQPSPAAAARALVSPRRILLGALPAELAALQQQFASLPAHRSPSKEQLQVHIQTAKPPAPAPAPGEATSKQQPGRLPRHLAESAKQQSVQQQPCKQPSKKGGAVDVAVKAAVTEGPGMQPVTGAASGAGASKSSGLERLRQRKARTSRADQQLIPASTSFPGTEEASTTNESEGLQQHRRAGSWSSERAGSAVEQTGAQDPGEYSARERPLAARLTPHVLAAAAQRAEAKQQPQAAQEGADGEEEPEQQQGRSSTDGRGRGCWSSSGNSCGDLGLTPAPWAALDTAAKPPTPPTTAHSNEVGLSAVAKPIWGTVAQGQSKAQPTAQPTSTPGRKSPLPMQRPPRSQLPPDLLSLRDSASLARSGVAGGPVEQGRRAHSLQEVFVPQEAAGTSSSVRACNGALPNHSPVNTTDIAGSTQPSPLAQPVSAELSQGAKQLASLRRQRRSEWLSDFGSTTPAWRSSQDGEGSGAQVPLTLISEDAVSFRGTSGPAVALDVASSPLMGGSREPNASAPPGATTRHAAPTSLPHQQPSGGVVHVPEGQSSHAEVSQPLQQAAVQWRQQGLTHAQLRQQEAWGDLAGLSLGEMLSQAPRQWQEAPAAKDLENVMAHSNTSSPTSKASIPSSPNAMHQHHNESRKAGQPGSHEQQHPSSRSGAAERHSRRRTVPHASFVESLERLAALHRARSDTEQQDSAIQWRLPAAMRHSNSLIRQGAGKTLPPLSGAQAVAPCEGPGDEEGPAAQLHRLRMRAGVGHLANSRRRGSQQHTDQPAAEQHRGGTAAACKGAVVGQQPLSADVPPEQPVDTAVNGQLQGSATQLSAPSPTGSRHTPDETKKTGEYNLRVTDQLLPAGQLPQPAGQWVHQPQQQQLPPSSLATSHLQQPEKPGDMQWHQEGQCRTAQQRISGMQHGWFAAPAHQSSPAHAPTWWQQQPQQGHYMQAMYPHSNVPYVAQGGAQWQSQAHLPSQQQQQLLHRQHSQQLHRQPSQSLQRQNSLSFQQHQQQQPGSGRRKWQVPAASTGHGAVPASAASGAAYAPSWGQQQQQYQQPAPVYGQQAYWHMPATARQRHSAYLTHLQHPHQHLAQQQLPPLQHQGSLHRYHSGGVAQVPHAASSFSPFMQQHIQNANVAAGSYDQGPELQSAARTLSGIVRR